MFAMFKERLVSSWSILYQHASWWSV